MQKMSDWHKQLLAGFIAAALSIAFVACFLHWRLSPSPQARQEMRHLMSVVQLGDTKLQVRRAFESGNYKHLRLPGRSDSTLWRVSTPFELGAGNWILHIEFKNSKVVALRLRIADSDTMRPRDPAPPDRVLPRQSE